MAAVTQNAGAIVPSDSPSRRASSSFSYIVLRQLRGEHGLPAGTSQGRAEETIPLLLSHVELGQHPHLNSST